jgi:hypothetical protein
VFKFVDWKDRPEKFVIPSWDNESAETPVEGKEEKKFDEIPF